MEYLTKFANFATQDMIHIVLTIFIIILIIAFFVKLFK